MNETEELLHELRSMINDLAKVKIEKLGEMPEPIVRDREGKLAKELTVKEWFAKIHEEVVELENEVLGCFTLEDKPGMMAELYPENKKLIANELCDVIKVLYSMAYQMYITGNHIGIEMHRNNVKTIKRGYHND